MNMEMKGFWNSLNDWWGLVKQRMGEKQGKSKNKKEGRVDKLTSRNIPSMRVWINNLTIIKILSGVDGLPTSTFLNRFSNTKWGTQSHYSWTTWVRPSIKAKSRLKLLRNTLLRSWFVWNFHAWIISIIGHS